MVGEPENNKSSSGEQTDVPLVEVVELDDHLTFKSEEIFAVEQLTYFTVAKARENVKNG